MADNRIAALTGTPGGGNRNVPSVLDMLVNAAPPGVTPQATPRTAMELLVGAAPKATPMPEVKPISDPGVMSEFLTGIKSGAQRLPFDFAAAGSVAAQAFGFEESAKEWIDFAMRGNEQLATEMPHAVPFEEAFSSPYNFALFAARNLGEQAPIMASTLLGGGAGSVIGRLVGRGALSAAEGTAAASRFGAVVGAGTTAVGMETGGTAQEIYGATGEIRPAVAFSAGIAKGALESVVPLAFAKRFGLGDDVAEGLLGRINKTLDELPFGKRVATGAALGLGVEGATEAMQEAVDIAARAYVDENYDALGPEAAMRILEAAVTGALVGGVMGGIGGTVGGKPDGNDSEGELPPGGGNNNPDPGDPARPDPAAPANPSPGGPKGVRTKAPFIPDEQEIVDPPAGTTTTQVAVQTGIDSENKPIIEFLSPTEAQFRAAEIGKGFKAWALPAGSEANLDTTVVTREIPPNFLQGLTFVDGTPPENVAKAQAKIASARVSLDEATELEISSDIDTRDVRRDAQALRDEAEVAYKEAIALGARIKPEPGQSFMMAGALPEGITPIRVSGPQANAPGNLTMSPEYGITFMRGDNEHDANTDELTVRSHIDAGGTVANRGYGKRFALDLRKAEANGIIVSNVATERWYAELGDVVDLAGFKKAVSEAAQSAPVTGIKIKTGMTEAEWQNAFDAYSTLQIEMRLNNGQQPKIGKQRNLAQKIARNGITMRPRAEYDAVFIGPSKKIIGLAREVPGIPGHHARKETDMNVALATRLKEILFKTRNVDGSVSYDHQNHKKGTVVIRYDNPNGQVDDIWTSPKFAKIQEQAARIAKLYEHLMHTYGLADRRLILRIGNPYNHGGTGGHYGADLTGIQNEIMINAKDLIDGTQSGFSDRGVATIIHEFGHFLTIQRFRETPKPLQEKMYRAYQRDMIKASMGNIRDTAAFLNAARFELFTANVSLERSSLWLNQSNPNYLLNFDEWMAEQTAKYFTTRAPGLSRLEKFFKGIAKQMRGVINRVFRNLGLTLNDVQPNQIMSAWIESMKVANLGAVPNYSPAMDARQFGQEESQRENEKILLMEEGMGTPSGEMSEKMDAALEKLGIPSKNKKFVTASVGRMNWLMKWGFTIRQLSQVNPSIKGLRLYNELIDRWALTKAQVQTRADATIKQWRAMSRTAQDNLSKFIFDIDAMVYLKPGEKPRYPTDAELVALGQKYSMKKEGLEVYQRMRQDLLAFLQRMEDIAIRDVNETVDNEAIAMVRIAEIKSEFRALKSRPYFPHSRFGDFSIVVKDAKTGKTLYMEQFASKREAESHAPDIHKMFPGASIRVDKIPEEVKPFRGLPPFLLTKLQSLPGITADQKIWIDNLVVELAPTQSFRKRLTRRLNVPGYSLDAMRSYANYMWHGANYLARVEYQRPLNDAISLVDADASRTTDDNGMPFVGRDVTKLRGIADFMRNHMEQVLNPAPDWASLRSVAFTWWLGFSPVAAFTNLTQNAVTTYPYLGSRFGDLKALNAMRRALGDMGRVARGKMETLPPDMEKAIARAVEKGITDESFAAELAATSEGGNLSGLLPGNKFQRAFMQFSHYSAWLYQGAEKLNRRVAFNAGWRLAMENPQSPHLQALKTENQLEYQSLIEEGFSEIEALAYLSARDSVWTTQYQYSAAARPRVLRGRKGVLLAFMSFVQNALFFATHDKGRARFMLMMMLIGGLMGLPGAEDINGLVKFIARKLLGKEVDIERETREFVVNLTENPEYADIMLNGISRVGFGIPHMLDMAGLPAPEFDVSANVGLGQIIPGVAELGSTASDFDSAMSRSVESVAGAVYGIGLNVLHTLSDDELPWTDGKRFERALPRAVKGAMRSYRYFEEGRERNRQGATLLEFNVEDPDHSAEIIMQGLGFTPTRLSRQWDRARTEIEVTAFWRTRRGLLMKQFDQAMESGDKAVVGDVASAIRRFNNEIPSPGYGISNKDLRTSRKERERRRRLTEAGLPQNKADIPVTQAVRRLYPTEHKVIDAEPAPKG